MSFLKSCRSDSIPSADRVCSVGSPTACPILRGLGRIFAQVGSVPYCQWPWTRRVLDQGQYRISCESYSDIQYACTFQYGPNAYIILKCARRPTRRAHARACGARTILKGFADYFSMRTPRARRAPAKTRRRIPVM